MPEHAEQHPTEAEWLSHTSASARLLWVPKWKSHSCPRPPPTILGVLHAAHQKRIARRELKPANIPVTKQGITQALMYQGQIVGTLQCRSPEQLGLIFRRKVANSVTER
jgi:hypothetical protein